MQGPCSVQRVSLRALYRLMLRVSVRPTSAHHTAIARTPWYWQHPPPHELITRCSRPCSIPLCIETMHAATAQKPSERHALRTPSVNLAHLGIATQRVTLDAVSLRAVYATRATP